MIERGIKATDRPIKVTWDDVKFSVKVKDSSKKTGCCGSAVKQLDILKGCSGSAMPGQCTYIMGSSGAGKTSLLNIISDRMSTSGGNKREGEVKVNDTKELD